MDKHAPPTFPSNTAAPPRGWDVVTEVDGCRPMGWFTRVSGDMRAVVRGYPTWDDAPFEIPQDARTPDFDDEKIDELGQYLQGTFDLYYRGYLFPNVEPAVGPTTHTFTNLDFCGGWGPAVGWERKTEALLERTIAGLKPASLLVPQGDEQAQVCIRAARDAGLDVISDVRGSWVRLWVAPARLADRVDHETLAETWNALATADPDARRGKRMRGYAKIGLSKVFDLNLLQPVPRGNGPEFQPWWDEETEVGLVILGAVLGYPPASTYALLADTYGEMAPWPAPGE